MSAPHIVKNDIPAEEQEKREVQQDRERKQRVVTDGTVAYVDGKTLAIDTDDGQQLVYCGPRTGQQVRVVSKLGNAGQNVPLANVRNGDKVQLHGDPPTTVVVVRNATKEELAAIKKAKEQAVIPAAQVAAAPTPQQINVHTLTAGKGGNSGDSQVSATTRARIEGQATPAAPIEPDYAQQDQTDDEKPKNLPGQKGARVVDRRNQG